MTAHLDVHFHGIEKSAAIEERIREKVAKLESHFDRITNCRVVIEAPHRNAAKPKAVHVKIEMSVPGQPPIIVNADRDVAAAQTDLNLAIRDAFEAATRRIDDIATKLAGRAKAERSRRKPAAGSDD